MAEILRHMQVFERVVARQSFSHAAKDLFISRSMVSQYIKQLEEDLGVQLLVRTTRNIALTPSGQEFYASCQKVVDEAEVAQQKVKDYEQEPNGTIRITAPVDLSMSKLPQVLTSFIELYPKVDLELSFNDEISNLVAEKYDVALRVGWLKDSSLRVAKLLSMRPVICASQDYIDKHGVPRTLAAIKEHRWLALSVLPSPSKWVLRHSKTNKQATLKFEPTVVCDSPMGLYGCVRAGLGLGFCPDYQVKDDVAAGRIKPLLTGYLAREGGVYAVYPYQGVAPLRVQKLIQHLRSEMV